MAHRDDRSPFITGALEWLYDGQGVPSACPGCGFSWATPIPSALDLITASPAAYAALLKGRDGMAAPADGSWNATSYVWHVADLARAWSERWILIAAQPGALLAGWDPDDLADARNYRNLPTVSGLWALGQATETFLGLSRVLDPATRFLHGDWGRGTVGEALVWLGHEFVHHQRDVDRRAVRA